MAMNGRSVPTQWQNAPGSELTIYCDGRYRHYHNGTKGTWAFVVEDREGGVRDTGRGFCTNGVGVTGIVAEYEAVIKGLGWAITNAEGASVEVCTNLELIEQQVSGSWEVKTAKLLPLRAEVRALLEQANATLRWISKKQNKLAHKLSLSAYRVEGEGVSTL